VQPRQERDRLADLAAGLPGLLAGDRGPVGEAAQPPLDVPGGEPLEELAVLALAGPGQGLVQPALEQRQVAVDGRQDAVGHQQVAQVGHRSHGDMPFSVSCVTGVPGPASVRSIRWTCGRPIQVSPPLGRLIRQNASANGASSGRIRPVPSSSRRASRSARTQLPQTPRRWRRPSRPQISQVKSPSPPTQPVHSLPPPGAMPGVSRSTPHPAHGP